MGGARPDPPAPTRRRAPLAVGPVGAPDRALGIGGPGSGLHRRRRPHRRREPCRPLLGHARSRLDGAAGARGLEADGHLARRPARPDRPAGGEDAGLQRGDVTRNRERVAEVAVPQTGGFVLLFAASLRATLRNVELVRERLIWGGLIALGLSILVG